MKSEKTYELEEIITIATARAGRVGCAEVSLDEYGIVDFISMDISGAKTVRCYELKISRSDFLSDAKKTFIGDFNYYVIPTELWMDVRGHIEPGIGVWTVSPNGKVSVQKQASRMECKMNRGLIMRKILKALNRENIKHCENNWRKRQTNKKIIDAAGGSIEVGDIVKYKADYYEVIEIEYNREQMTLNPTLVLALKNKSGGIINVQNNIHPAIVRKLPAQLLQ